MSWRLPCFDDSSARRRAPRQRARRARLCRHGGRRGPGCAAIRPTGTGDPLRCRGGATNACNRERVGTQRPRLRKIAVEESSRRTAVAPPSRARGRSRGGARARAMGLALHHARDNNPRAPARGPCPRRHCPRPRPSGHGLAFGAPGRPPGPFRPPHKKALTAQVRTSSARRSLEQRDPNSSPRRLDLALGPAGPDALSAASSEYPASATMAKLRSW